MIDDIDAVGLRMELEHSHCELSHGPRDTQPHKAIDYLVMPTGYKGQADSNLVIPVCQDCLDGISDPAWTLVYCLECGESQWILREIAKMQYRHDILWLAGCPTCGGEFGGIWFNDPAIKVQEWDLLLRNVA